MLIDIHLHSRFSFDSEENPEKYIVKAKESGVPVIGFSEHYDYDAFLDGADISLADIQEYSACLSEYKKICEDPHILFGIEFGYSKAAVEKYKTLAERYNFDYIINSVHTLPNRGDSYYPRYFEGLTTRRAYENYFNAVLESVDAPFDYQIIGHIGYVSRYNDAPDKRIIYADYKSIIDEILLRMISKGKCLEINTSSGKSGCDFLPDRDILIRYCELGGELMSFGSDAHKCPDYARKEELLAGFLREIGVKKLYYYKNRKPVAYDI